MAASVASTPTPCFSRAVACWGQTAPGCHQVPCERRCPRAPLRLGCCFDPSARKELAVMSGRIVFGFGLGIVAIAAAPYAVPVVAAVGRPLVKAVVKQT